jgi:hypothetical protein
MPSLAVSFHITVESASRCWMRHWRSAGASQENDAAIQHSASADDRGGGHGAVHDKGVRIDSDQGRSNSLVYKDIMVVPRFMVMIATALLIVASLGLGAVAAKAAYAPPLYSSMDSLDHDDCEGAGNQDVDSHGCCQGVSCASTGVLAQLAIVAPIILSLSQPNPGVGDHLFGRSITPETGPPKLLA